jgi:hypothetical protein
MEKESDAPLLLIGWREYVVLPKLGLRAIKAKVDTGARTSSLHAFAIEPFHEDGILKVRFHVHPLRKRDDIIVKCEAVVADYRYVSDSGGHREKRYVIKTPIAIGSHMVSVEVTLANRETMSYRMLLGRSAMKSMKIDPSQSYLQGRPVKLAKKKGTRKKAKKQKE